MVVMSACGGGEVTEVTVSFFVSIGDGRFEILSTDWVLMGGITNGVIVPLYLATFVSVIGCILLSLRLEDL